MLAIQLLSSLLLTVFAAAQQTTNNATGIHGIPEGLGDVGTTLRSASDDSQLRITANH